MEFRDAAPSYPSEQHTTSVCTFYKQTSPAQTSKQLGVMRFAGPGRRYRVERSADGHQWFPFNTGEEIPGHGARWSAPIPKPLLPLELYRVRVKPLFAN
jgi:hypothetical protein